MRFLSEQWSCETELHEKPSLGPEGCFEAQSPAWCLCPSHQPVAVWLCTLGHNLHLSDGCSLLWPYLLCGGKASVRCSGLRLCSHFQCSTQRRNYGRKSLDAKKKILEKYCSERRILNGYVLETMSKIQKFLQTNVIGEKKFFVLSGIDCDCFLT